jgi:4-amino-4-deoxy-L-arabinose transferase-like glycosyltransferase
MLLLLLAYALRLFNLEAQSLWFDEGVTLKLATSSPPDLIADRAANIHPPLYFIFMKGWAVLLGSEAFTGRYASVLFSLLQIPIVLAVARRWLGAAAGGLAAVLVALWPLSIIYAQEMRVYALLPLVALLLLYQTWRLLHRPQASWQPWLYLGLLVWAGLHLHYVMAFVVAYAALWLAVALWRQGRKAALRRWFVTYLLVALFSLPWVAIVLGNWAAVQQELTGGYQLAEAPPLPFVLEQVWLFHWTGLAGTVGSPVARWIGRALALLLLLLLAWRRPRQRSALLVAHWLIPLCAAFILWSIRASAHPRYLTVFAIFFLLLLAWLGAPRRPLRWPALLPTALLALPLLALTAFSLNGYFVERNMGQKEDVRGVARHLQAVAAADDLIVAPYKDWSLSFEYQGRTPLLMPELGDPEALWAQLSQRTRAGQRVYLLRRNTGSLDWQELLPYALEEAGALQEVRRFDGLTLYAYELQQSVAAPSWIEQRQARFGSLALTATALEPLVPANTAIPIALTWQPLAPQPGHYWLALTLRDVDGWPISRIDRQLVGPRGQGTAGWAVGEPLHTYHRLPIPPGTAPLSYTVTAEVYGLGADGAVPLSLLDEQGAPRGTSLALPPVQLTPPVAAGGYDVQAQPPAWEQPLWLAPELSLVAAALDRETVAPGETLFVRLRWRALASDLPQLQPQLVLEQDGVLLAQAESSPTLQRYPTSRWQEGEEVAEQRQLSLPATAEEGVAEVFMTLGAARVKLGEVRIAGVARRFDAPPVSYRADARFGDVARLVGFDLPQTEVTGGEPLPLTLVWESLATGAQPAYTVFVHLVAPDGRIVAQDDAPPNEGRRPTNGWVSGEYVVDTHHLRYQEPEYRGPGQIVVGLYDPISGVRLTLPDGTDSYRLPLQLTITGE